MAVQLYGSPGATITLPERFERKYYLPPAKVGLAYGLLRQICLPSTEYASEQINSLYFDTTDLDQHERSLSGDFYKDKIRIRWYGEDKDLLDMHPIFIELKSRRGFSSTKQRLRLSVPAGKLEPDNLTKGIVPLTLLRETLARFGHFPSQILLPVIKISYWRYRFSDIISEQLVSLDCRISSTVVMQGIRNREKKLELPGGVIEIKGNTMELPVTLRQAKILDTDWTRFSKYSACIDAHSEITGSIGYLSPSGKIV